VVGGRWAGGAKRILDPADRVVENLPEFAHGVVADGLGVPGGGPQVSGELLGQPFKVTVGARVRPAARAVPGPAAAA
jgi:hypothetical protein